MPNKGYKWKKTMWQTSDGKSVMDFCRETGACYQTVWKYIVAEKMSVDDACKTALERKGNKDGATKYFVNGMSLHRYCLENGLNYSKLCKQKREVK